MEKNALQQHQQLLSQSKIEVTVTAQDIARYGDISQDYNTIHFEKEAAQRAGFPDIVAHGMLTMGFANRLLSEHISPTSFIQSFEITFSAPVFVGDILSIISTLTDDVIRIEWSKTSGEHVGRGKAKIERYPTT